jgi:UDP-N-acetylmuramyl pentapeptide phosphotransferase/UDP-N-acetylglucosamine-1-phosphate transferase
MNILSQEVILGLLNDYYLLFAISLFLGSFAATFYIMPKVIWVAKEKGLLADVNERSAHVVATPSFGGVTFFIILVMPLSPSLRVISMKRQRN